MKLFSKIFLSTLVILTLALSILEYATISVSFQNSIRQERADASGQFRLLRYALQSNIVMKKQMQELDQETLQEAGEEISQLVASGYGLDLYNEVGIRLFQGTSHSEEVKNVEDMEKGKVRSSIQKERDSYWLIVEGIVSQADVNLVLVMEKNITDVFQRKHQLEKNSQLLFAVILAGAAVLMFFMTLILTRPIKKLKSAVKKISAGEYGQRIKIRSKDEIGDLGQAFNVMAGKIQENVEELQEEAQRKEQFVSDFAHELKTPLTSIIGYADRIYQHETDREETKQAAAYIFSEGMRLESLAFKMMDLAVLNRQNFVKEVVDAREFQDDIRLTFQKVMEEKGILFQIRLESAYLKVEYDFFKTLLVNLLDNAVKAGSTKIAFTGKLREKEIYEFRITDNGCGIPKEELKKITEAFYMVDKARSRKMNGAGLGLAIAQKIAQLHETSLEYQSRQGVGTSVVFRMKVEGDQEDELD